MTVKPNVKQIQGEPAVAVSNLSIEIGGRCIIRDANFTIPKGSGLAVIGPNGSGKTVLVRALLGLLPYTGSVRWAHGSRQGYVPQKVSAAPNMPMRVREILAAKAFVQKMTSADIADAVASRCAFQRSIATGALSDGNDGRARRGAGRRTDRQPG